MLEVCFGRMHPELKDRPAPEWPSAKRIAEAIRQSELRKKPTNQAQRDRRDKMRKRRQRENPDAGRRATARYRARHPDTERERHRDQAREWRKTEQGIRNEVRQTERKARGVYAARHLSKLIASDVATLALKNIEAPEYGVIGAHGTRRHESWPLNDAAARWLEAAQK